MRSEDTCCGHILTIEEKRARSREAVRFSRENGLKKCPSCGRYPSGHRRNVICRCGMSSMGDDAFQVWNRRANEQRR